MNEKAKNIIIVILLTLLISGSIAFFFYQRSSSARIEQYRIAESTASTTIEQLRNELYEFDKRLSSVNAELQQYHSFNAEARTILTSQKSSIDKLRELIESLPE